MKNIFWNMENNSKKDDKTIIEHTIKYGDFDDIVKLFKKYNKNYIKTIWLENIANDKRFLKLNLMMARIFFDMNVESNYFEGLKNGRFKNRVFVK
jgi:hypothetical protein